MKFLIAGSECFDGLSILGQVVVDIHDWRVYETCECKLLLRPSELSQRCKISGGAP